MDNKNFSNATGEKLIAHEFLFQKYFNYVSVAIVLKQKTCLYDTRQTFAYQLISYYSSTLKFTDDFLYHKDPWRPYKECIRKI